MLYRLLCLFFPITGEDYFLEESNRNVFIQTALFALFVVFAIIHDDSRRKPGLIKEVIARSFCIFAITGEDHCEPVLIEQSKAKIDRHLPNI